MYKIPDNLHFQLSSSYHLTPARKWPKGECCGQKMKKRGRGENAFEVQEFEQLECKLSSANLTCKAINGFSIKVPSPFTSLSLSLSVSLSLTQPVCQKLVLFLNTQQQRKLLPFSTSGPVEHWRGTYQQLCLGDFVSLNKHGIKSHTWVRKRSYFSLGDHKCNSST